MAADCRVVAKYFIFNNRLSTPNGVEEISLMIWNGVVTRWCGERLHFLVHPASDDPDVIRAYAEREGSEVLITHMRDQAAILEFVAGRERDVGGEG